MLCLRSEIARTTVWCLHVGGDECVSGHLNVIIFDLPFASILKLKCLISRKSINST